MCNYLIVTYQVHIAELFSLIAVPAPVSGCQTFRHQSPIFATKDVSAPMQNLYLKKELEIIHFGTTNYRFGTHLINT